MELSVRCAKPAASTPVEDQIPTVSVVVPGRQTVSHLITATGSLAARREMPVGVAGQGGLITRVLVDPGDWVKAGQVLATVDRSVQTQTAASLAAQVNVAQSDARLAQANLDRAQKLVSDGFISKADIDQLTATRDGAIAKVHVAQAQLAEARAQNAQLDIRAPAAGLVLTRGAEPGQIVNQSGGALFRMAKDGEIELDARLPESPCCLVVDVRMPQIGGFECRDRLLERGIDLPVIFLTGHGDIPMSVKAMKAGAFDFMTKPFRDQELLDAVEAALTRDAGRRSQDRVLADSRARYESLTPREKEVMAGVTRGLLNKQVAAELGISEITVKLHRSSLMKKLGVRAVADLVRLVSAAVAK